MDHSREAGFEVLFFDKDYKRNLNVFLATAIFPKPYYLILQTLKAFTLVYLKLFARSGHVFVLNFQNPWTIIPIPNFRANILALTTHTFTFRDDINFVCENHETFLI